jgi:hypothetical protein
MLIRSRRDQGSTLVVRLGRSLALLALLLACISGRALAAPIAFVQSNSATPQSPQTTVTVTYTAAQTLGNLNIVVVGWNDSTATVSTVTDSRGNAYAVAAAPVVQSGTASQAIYYAKNISPAAAAANTVTVTFSVAAAFADIRIAEYSGLDTVNPLDGSFGAQGSTTSISDSGPVTTTSANDLLVGANLVQSTTTGAGAGYTNRTITQDGDILEDRIVTVTGSYNATAALDRVQPWIMQIVAFRTASSGTPAPSITSLNPISGPVGTSVTIAGANFGASQGTSTVTFNGTASTPTAWSTTSIAVPVPTGATTGNVVVTVSAQPSNGVNFSVGNISPILFVQTNSASPQATQTPVAVTYTSAQAAGNLNVVIVSWNDSTATVSSVTDSIGNAYAAAAAPVVQTGTASQAIYYAKNIAAAAAGANTVTVNFNVAARHPDIRIAEYNGVDPLNPLDASVGAQGNTVTSDSGPVATTNANDILIGANVVQSTTTAPGTGYTSRGITVDGDILEDQVVSATGSYNASAVLDKIQLWIMQIVAFRAAVSGGSPVPNIAGLNPTSGPVGTSVTINGSNFGATQGTSTVKFNGTTATPSSWTTTSIVVPVPAGATSGNVVVTVGGLASNGAPFTVMVITVSVSPTTLTLGTGASQNFSAMLQNDGQGKGVTWSLSGLGCSGAACGTIAPNIAAPGEVYTAPATAPNPSTVSLTATSVTDPTKSATATITVVQATAPNISSLNPSSGPLGSSVTITGTNFGNSQGSSVVSFNTSTSVVTSWSNTSIVATVPTSLLGNANALVQVMVLGLASNQVNFSITPTPTITSLNPTTGPVAAFVTITGGNFGATQGTSTVTFNGVAATPTAWSATSITATVPAAATSGNVVVTVGGQPSNGINFTVTPPPPIVSSLNPTSGVVGTLVAIAGGNFGATQGASTVTFNGAVATPTSWSATSIAVAVPSGATTGNVVVTVGGQSSNGVGFTVTVSPPSITSLNPTSGAVGTSITVAGANFGATQGSSSVAFNGTTGTPTAWSATSITVAVPTAATTGNVVVIVGGQASNGISFTVTLPPPSITSLNPTSGAVGASITIGGTNFGATQGTSTVMFNGTAGTPTAWSASSIAVPVPAGATAGNVIVTVGGQTSNSVNFTIIPPPPSISSLTPASGPVGTSVTIAGASFGATQGTSAISFNGISATPTSWTASSIVVPVPTGAITGNVVLTVGGQASNGSNFTVTTSTTGIALVQHRSKDAGIAASSTLAFNSNNTAGNWIAVVIRAGRAGQVFTVSDTRGNFYRSAIQFNVTSDAPSGDTLGVFYAENIAGGANTVTAAESISGNTLRFAILEYSGVALANSLDVVSTAQGNGATANSGNALTTANGDLLLGAILTGNPETFTAAAGYTIEERVPASPNTKLAAEDQVQAAAGTVSAGVTFGASDSWGAGLAAFKAASGGGTTGPLITSLNPTAGFVGSSVTITGTNFGATQGTSTVTFNGASATPTSWNTTSIAVPVPTSATTGIVVVTVGGTASNGVTFTVTVPSPAIASLNPTSGLVGTSVTITGTNFGASQGTSTVKFNGTAGTPTSWSATTIAVPVPTGATAGNVVVTVGGASSNGVSFTVLIPPSITSLTPNSGTVGTSITVAGANFGTSQGTSTVTFNGTAAAPTSWTATSIGVPVPAGTTTGNVVVTVGGLASNAVNFAVVVPPSITSLAPNSGTIGTSITISGANFGTTQGTSTVTFNGIAATPTSWNATTIAVPVPNGATTGNVIVTVSGVASNGVTFTVTTPGPSLSTLGLTQGPVGATVTITGTNFGATQGSSTVTFNGTVGTPSVWGATSIDVPVPVGATTGNVVVTVGGVASNGLSFTVTPPPNITSISPTSGPIGTVVTINGTNFGPTVGTRVSGVTFNGVAARTNSWSDSLIVVPVPAGATTGNVVVSISGVVSNAVNFTIATPPSITSLNPTSGPVGTSVTIAGTNFGASQGTSTVTFSGTAATATAWSATSITATVPTGAITGNVVVTVAGLASTGVNFTVTSSGAPIALVQHTSMDAGTTTFATLAFPAPNTAGDWIAVVIRAGKTGQVFTVTDARGNTYRKAIQFNETLDGTTLGVLYAESIAGGTNTINVSDTTSGTLRFAILEYSGVTMVNSLDAVVTKQGAGITPNSGNLLTSASGDLLLGGISTANAAGFTPGSGYLAEELVPAAPNTKLLVEDQIQAAPAQVSAGASLGASDNWGAFLAAFKSASGAPPPPIAVTVIPATVSVGNGGGTQPFTAQLMNDIQNKGVNWALTGAGCSGSACGTLTNITSTSVTYNAPVSVPNPATVTLTATSVADSTKTSTATITIVQGLLTVSLSPKRGSITASQTQQFTATVFNDPNNAGVTWQVDGNTGGNSTTGTISTTGLFTPGTQPGLHTITATSITNASANASVSFAVTDLPGVLMHHNDPGRTGQNLKEYALTPANVHSSAFTQLFSCPVDGYVYAQPLWVPNLTVGATVHNVLFIATEHDSVYAFDADSPSCTQLWKTSFLGTGVTTMSWQDTSSSAPTNDVFPEIGITSTPVINPATNTIYVVAKTKETGTGCPCYPSRLHALDIATGTEKFGGPATIDATNFVSLRHFNRPGLLLANNTIYIGFGSHGDISNWQGWLFGYDPATLAQKFVFSTSDPTIGSPGASVWGGGAGPAADASGNIYVTTGNGFYDGVKNFSESVLKISPTGTLLDWFTPFNRSVLDANDIDMGSAGMMILPDSVGSAVHPHLALATGKIAILYLLDQTNLGKFNSSANQDVQEVIPVPPPNTTQLDGGLYGLPAYWNGFIYTTGQNFPLSQFTISNGSMATPQFAVSSNMFPPRGATPSVSANGNTNGVVWVLDLSGWPSNGNAILYAYDATNVSNLLFSSPSTGTGAAGPAVKFTVPTIANGKVYVGGQSTFVVFGLLPN